MKMPFGKFKGRTMDKIPSGYLKWLAENMADEEICVAADEEYRERTDNNEHWWEDFIVGEYIVIRVTKLQANKMVIALGRSGNHNIRDIVKRSIEKFKSPMKERFVKNDQKK